MVLRSDKLCLASPTQESKNTPTGSRSTDVDRVVAAYIGRLTFLPRVGGAELSFNPFMGASATPLRGLERESAAMDRL